MSRLSKRTALALIRAYQRGISPGLGLRCRYEPTCSVYAYDAITQFGVMRGSWAAARRLIRCRPGSPGGYDPVSADGYDLASNTTAATAPHGTAENGSPRVA